MSTPLLALSTPAWSGLSAIGGALVGGAVTGVATYALEGRRQRFEREERNTDRKREDVARHRSAVGIARVLQARYERVGELLVASAQQNVWLPGAVEPGPSIDDRKLLAVFVTSEEWYAIDFAETWLAKLLEVREVVLARRASAAYQAGEPVILVPTTETDHQGIFDAIDALREASTALARLAGAQIAT